MTKEIQCHKRLTKVFREAFDSPALKISDDHDASSIPGWDSLAHVNLVISIEEEFGINLQLRKLRRSAA